MPNAKPFAWWHYRAYLPKQHVLILDWMVPYIIGSVAAIFLLGLLFDGTLLLLWWQWLPLLLVSSGLFVLSLWPSKVPDGLWLLMFTLLTNLAMLLHMTGLVLLLLCGIYYLRQQNTFFNYCWRLLLLALTLWHGYLLDIPLLVLIIVAVIAIFNMEGDDFFLRYLRQQIDSLARKTEDEELARVAERERIARDLHDVLSQQLVAINLKSQLLLRQADMAEPWRAELAQIQQLSVSSLQDMRRLIAGYYQGQWQFELHSAEQLLSSQGIDWRAEIDIEPDKGLRSLLALALREGITNMLKHAQPQHASLSLSEQGSYCYFRLQNDGCQRAKPEQPSGRGLENLRLRLQSFAGLLQAEQQDRDFVLQIWLPKSMDQLLSREGDHAPNDA